ncbi:unnamed protein product [Pleuronectes platessa]|uniref:Uncharacterized protein n=1 Tax=Pleuronectes platessa TaxID=8262 RepID=A0A9N7YWU9_PLEPL|nr:unnamed protein product [Pleuronectes platessa]
MPGISRSLPCPLGSSTHSSLTLTESNQMWGFPVTADAPMQSVHRGPSPYCPKSAYSTHGVLCPSHGSTVGQTESWQPGSTYRNLPIQERAQRPLWTSNNGASAFVSCLWETQKESDNACDDIRECGVEVFIPSFPALSLSASSPRYSFGQWRNPLAWLQGRGQRGQRGLACD